MAGIADFNLTATKEARLPGATPVDVNRFTAANANQIINYLIDDKARRGEYYLGQDLRTTDGATFAHVTLSNFTSSNLFAVSDATGKLVPKTIAEVQLLLGTSATDNQRKIKQAVIAGSNAITFSTAFASTAWLWAGSPYIETADGERVEPTSITNYTAAGVTIVSPVAGTLMALAILI